MGLDICASIHPRLYPDVDADSSILEIAFCFPNGALPSVEFIAKRFSPLEHGKTATVSITKIW